MSKRRLVIWRCLSEKIAETVEAPLSDEEKDYSIAFKKRELQMKRLQWELEKRHRNVYGNHMTVEQKHTIDLAPALKRLNDKQAQREAMRVIETTEKPLELTKLSKDETIHNEIKEVKLRMLCESFRAREFKELR